MKEYIGLNACSILCGANSSGKSSLIQTVLMLAQTFSGKVEEESILLNGELVRLGAYKDIIKHYSNQDEITIGFEFDVNQGYFIRDASIESVKCELTIGKRDRGAAKPDEEYHPLIVAAKYFVKRKINSKEYKLDYIHFKLPANYRKLEEVEYEIVTYDTSESVELSKSYPNYKIMSLLRTGELIPTMVNITYDQTKSFSHELINYLLSGRKESHEHEDYFFQEFDFQDYMIPVDFSLSVYELIIREREQLLSEIEVPDFAMDILKEQGYFNNDFSDYSLGEYDAKIQTKKILEEFKSKFVNVNYSLKAEDVPEHFFMEPVSVDEWVAWINSLDDKKTKNISTLLEKYKDNLQNIWYENTERTLAEDYFHSSLLRDISSAMTYSFSKSIKYLGPLRNEPQAVYSSSPYDANTVGLKGEFTASLLHRIRSNDINYLSPSVINEKIYFEEKVDNVNNACKEWLSFLGVVEEVRTTDMGKLGYELYVKTAKGEKWQDLTHVGVGVSQVLPIILMFLHSDNSDILIFEQPELHLHPKVQSKLCDLFLIMAQTGRQCIIETHSEYLINRLRLRIAQDESDQWNSRSSLYFISKYGDNSHFQEVGINKFGAIPDWPKGFFDQTDREVEKILMEASKKKNRISYKGGANVSGY